MSKSENRQLRLFIAMPLPESAVHVLDAWCKTGQRHWQFAKWVHPQDLHITLQFLGAADEEATPRIVQALEQVSRKTDPFELHFEGVGSFGTKEAPRVLWAGLGGAIDRLRQLNHSVGAAVSPLGFKPEDRPYRPHITLARKYRGGEVHPFSMISEPLPSHQWMGEEIVLFRTHMNQSPMYERLHTFTLGQR
ncbi:RNA 2',3'-cyclic phosphodiesterase [Paenibacillus alvei]|uniref:RNA 2',3'-cyclic phosphodiesterase n=1 Tax=Paenibacillus alvei TaxID=44250 RepID=A0AAP6ZVJ6_PAEAL|nr:RNA 2',3'-cyclic phosphodiesterase [Paenibacillus alvei]NOJ70864.1 RNA 2',3'-cyclic phosphodiesterase [Paenibacillus alvei]